MSDYSDMTVPISFPGAESMGDNVKKKVKFCGKGVRLYPYCKIIRAENAKLDDECKIFDYVYIDAGKELIVGKYSIITWQSIIEGGAKTRIGDRVFLGPGSKLITGTYAFNGYYAVEYIIDECRKNIYGDIIIEDDVYIGAGSIVMPGTIIHEGAVIGANSFVKGELEPWTVYVGSPCRPVSKREKPSEEMRKTLFSAIDWSNHL